MEKEQQTNLNRHGDILIITSKNNNVCGVLHEIPFAAIKPERLQYNSVPGGIGDRWEVQMRGVWGEAAFSDGFRPRRYDHSG